MRFSDCLSLFLFVASAKQDDDSFPILAKVDAIAWASSILYSYTPEPTPLIFEKLPCSNRYKAVVTLAAAGESSFENQRANGGLPRLNTLAPVKCQPPSVPNGNTYVTIEVSFRPWTSRVRSRPPRLESVISSQNPADFRALCRTSYKDALSIADEPQIKVRLLREPFNEGFDF